MPASHPELSDFLTAIAAERGAAKNTLDAYRRDLDYFFAFLRGQNLDLSEVRSSHISAYLRHLQDQGANEKFQW